MDDRLAPEHVHERVERAAAERYPHGGAAEPARQVARRVVAGARLDGDEREERKPADDERRHHDQPRLRRLVVVLVQHEQSPSGSTGSAAAPQLRHLSARVRRLQRAAAAVRASGRGDDDGVLHEPHLGAVASRARTRRLRRAEDAHVHPRHDGERQAEAHDEERVRVGAVGGRLRPPVDRAQVLVGLVRDAVPADERRSRDRACAAPDGAEEAAQTP